MRLQKITPKKNNHFKWKYGIGVFLLSAVILAGCGDGTGEEAGTFPALTLDPEPVRTEEEVTIINYETKYNSGEFTMEDYRTLAGLYEKQGRIREQRDMLEKSYRLYGDSQAFETLQGLSINLAEEEPKIRQEAQTMLQNLEVYEYLPEGIHLIESQEWFDTMMPKLGEGVRNYFQQQDGETKLVIRAGYDTEGIPFSTVWYHGEGDQVMMLKETGGTVRIMLTALVEGNYEGEFTLLVLDGVTGSILKEQGTFEKGRYTGEYTLEIYEGSNEGDPYDLWNNRGSMIYVSHKGEADGQGDGELEQFAAKLEAYPEFTPYEAQEEQAEDQSNGQTDGRTEENEDGTPKLRVFDGEIQWLSDGVWISLGSIADYQKEDPFYSYESQKKGTQTVKPQGDGLNLDNIATPTPSPEPTAAPEPNPTKKPASTPAATPAPTKKPAASTPKPSVTQPAPTPAPQTPAPADDDDDDSGSGDNGGGSDSGGDNGGGSDSGGDNGGGSDSGGDNGGGSDSGGDNGGGSDGGGDSGGGDSDNSGNDVDIEWTDDIM